MQEFEEAEELLTYEVLSLVSLGDALDLFSDVVEVVGYHLGSVCVLQNSVGSGEPFTDSDLVETSYRLFDFGV